MHAILGRNIKWAPRHGPVHVAMQHHGAEIRRELEEHNDTLAKLVLNCEHSRNAELCVETLGLTEHRVIKSLKQAHGSQINRHPVIKDVVKAIYHIDRETLHTPATNLGPPPEDIDRHRAAVRWIIIFPFD